VIAGEEFTVEVRGAFDDVADISAVRYNSLEGATGRAESEVRMSYRKSFLVEPGQKLRLSRIDPSSKEKHETSETVAAELEAFRQKLTRLQALLYAAHKHSLLIVLQAMDAGGKDGTVNHVFAAFNAQGTTVTGFKQPTLLSATTTSSGGCILCPALARLPSSTARTTRTC